MHKPKANTGNARSKQTFYSLFYIFREEQYDFIWKTDIVLQLQQKMRH
jgi:hypothetical protein